MDSTDITPTDSGTSRTTAHAGSLTLTVWPDEPLGEHQRYAYRIEDTATGQAIEGRDLFTGVGAPVEPSRAIRELAVFLAAAAEARQYAIDNPGAHPENEGLFPAWTAEAARRDYTALTVLAEFDSETPDMQPAVQGKATPRWISVVFLQGAEADQALDLLDQGGADAAIEHLAGYDYGEETTQTALENGYVYDAPPTGMLDRTATRDVYTLVYNPFLGHVSLLREHDALPDPALLDIDIPAPTSARPGRRSDHSPRREAADWFSGPTGPAQSSRGMSL